jgi:hypothetical protein
MTNHTSTEDRSLRLRAASGVMTAVAIASTTIALAGPAGASGGDAVRSSGSCGGSVVWKLKAKHDNGRIDVEFEVDSNRVGQTWTVRLRDNGELFFSSQRTTQAPSGSFTVEKRTADRVGSDVIRARAVHGDRVCVGSVTV